MNKAHLSTRKWKYFVEMMCWKYEIAKGIVVEALVVSNFVYPVVTYQILAH
jgi:hypothetical protein